MFVAQKLEKMVERTLFAQNVEKDYPIATIIHAPFVATM